MKQDVAQLLKHAFVELGVAALDGEFDLLAQLERHTAGGAMQTRRQIRERYQSDRHQAVLELGPQPGLSSADGVELLEREIKIVARRLGVGGELGNFARDAVELGIAIELQLVELVVPRLVRGGPDQLRDFVAVFEVLSHAPEAGYREAELL